MKTIKYMFMIIAAIAAISCIQEENPVTDSNKDIKLIPMTFTASIDKGADTKVMYDGAKTKWEANDKIMVISNDGSANEFNIVSLENDGTTAVFSGESSENAKEYYAVYPSSAYKGDGAEAVGKEGKLYVEVKATQQAIAGTFDPSAALAIARSDADGNIVFKHSCAYLKFQLADAADVKKVHLSVNGSDNVAGIGYLGVSASDLNTQFATSDDKLSKYNMITLLAPEDGFVAGEDYIIAMRANSCPNGLTMYVEYNDCVKSRTSSNKVFVEENGISGSIGKIKDLGQLDKNLTTLTPYEAYNFGADIMVAGKAINKAVYGEATLVTTSQDLKNNGVYFINPDIDKVTISSSKSIVAIGNDPTKRSKISRSGVSYIPATSDNDYWILSNLELTVSTGSDQQFQLNSGNVCETVIIDNCSSNIPAKKNYIYGNSSQSVKEIIIKDSEFVVEAGSSINFLNFAATQIVDNITFENNVFYSVDIAEPAANFVLISAGNTTATNLTLHKNTFYGAYTQHTVKSNNSIASGNITNCKTTNITVTKNLFGVRNDIAANTFVAGNYISGNMNFTDNAYWKSSTDIKFGVSTVTDTYSKNATGTKQSISSKGISTDKWNPAEGKFTLNSGFGATR